MSFIYKYKISHGFTKGVSGGDVWYLEINYVLVSKESLLMIIK